jgi:hypothetical protein
MIRTITEENVPLASGDHLTRDEFMRRWEAHPEIKHAELIDGIAYLSERVSVEHGEMHGAVGGWLGVYRTFTPGTASGNNSTLCFLDDVAQPDTNLRILPECDGRSWVEEKYLHGSPELLAEICLSSASYDLHTKLKSYQASRIPEYLAVLLYEEEIRWHVLVDGRYQLLPPDPDRIWRSRVFPGLWLDGAALLKGNMTQVLARLQDGLNSPEHNRFVEDLGRRRQTKASASS